MIGEHRVIVVAYEDETSWFDMSRLIDDVSVTHGRTNTTEQPDASACTVNFTVDALTAPLSNVVDIGARVIVSTLVDDLETVRFGGRITDLSLGWDEAGTETPDTGVGQLTAVNVLGDLGHRYVGDEPWPQELDGARVARVAQLAGITLDPALSDPGTVRLLPRDVDRSDALGIAHAAAESAGGVLWTTRAGVLHYADADHRRGILPLVTLDACDVLVTPTWARTLEGLTNEVSISYGPVPEGGAEQPRYHDIGEQSQLRYGRYSTSLTTQLAELADAEALGSLLLTRNAYPVWVLSALPLDMAGLDPTDTRAVLNLEMHDLIRVTGLPELGQAPTSAVLWVEGFSETLAYGEHSIALVVSGYCRTSPPPLWDDLDPDQTWNNIGTPTWDDAACLGPRPTLGRWNDTAATLRWDQVAATVTWDTYELMGKDGRHA